LTSARRHWPTIGEVILQVAAFAELDAPTLYALLRLRCDVFVVEQRCPYPELDGRDIEPGTRHLWLVEPANVAPANVAPADVGPATAEPATAEPATAPAAYLRMLTEVDGTARIGRVCTATPYRGRGLAGSLMSSALDLIGPASACVLDAQAHLVGFYRRFGFSVTGGQYLDDGIPHVPMGRPAGVLADRLRGGEE
jgi:ElaA protein